jgi:hypothetical protein
MPYVAESRDLLVAPRPWLHPDSLRSQLVTQLLIQHIRAGQVSRFVDLRSPDVMGKKLDTVLDFDS